MFRKLLGLLVLLSFLFVKGNMLPDVIQYQKAAAQHMEKDADQSADDEKESKNMEFADEFISHSLISLSPVLPSKKLIHTDFYDIAIVHFPVWGPPPNCAVAFNA